MSTRRLATIVFPDCTIGFAHMFEPTDSLRAYLDEIALLYNSNRPFYLFLRGTTLVYTTEKDEIVAAGLFAHTNLNRPLPATYNRYSFDTTNEDLEMKIVLNRPLSDETRQQMANTLPLYCHMQALMPFDVVKIGNGL